MFLLKLQKLTISKSKIFTTNFLQKCGADRVRTCDPLRAREVLSQLSYSPKYIRFLWVWVDSNYRPPPYQSGALTN